MYHRLPRVFSWVPGVATPPRVGMIGAIFKGVIVEKARDLLVCDAAVVYGVDDAGERLTALRGLNVDPALLTNFALRVGEGASALKAGAL